MIVNRTDPNDVFDDLRFLSFLERYKIDRLTKVDFVLYLSPKSAWDSFPRMGDVPGSNLPYQYCLSKSFLSVRSPQSHPTVTGFVLSKTVHVHGLTGFDG